MLLAVRLVGVSSISILTGLLRPAGAALVMMGMVLLIQFVIPDPAWLRLPAAVVVGALAFGGSLMLLWRLAGRPNGFERDATTHIAGWLRGRGWRRTGTPARSKP